MGSVKHKNVLCYHSPAQSEFKAAVESFTGIVLGSFERSDLFLPPVVRMLLSLTFIFLAGTFNVKMSLHVTCKCPY